MNRLTIYIFILFLMIITNLSCNRDKFDPDKITFEEAITTLPLYYNFLDHLINEGYEFWDFHKYWISDKENLPDKLMVLRHDVHHRDVYFAYYMHVIEKELIGDNVATYYIMLNNPASESNNDAEAVKDDYLDLIRFLENKDVDVQPHISPCDMYTDAYNPTWENISVEELKVLVSNNYQFQYFDNGININVVGVDTLNLAHINSSLVILLKKYNQKWHSSTGLIVESYAAHGSSSPLNHALGNVTLLNQRELLATSIYQFETSNTIIRNYLTIIHDNWRPEWIESPQLIEPNVYELLVHPYVWNDPQSWRDEYGNIKK